MTKTSQKRRAMDAEAGHGVRPMRLCRLSAASAICLSLFAFACNDSAPTYPAIIIYGNEGNGTGTGATTGSGPTGSGNSTSSANGGSGNASNGPTTDPLYAHCNNPWSGADPPVGKVQCNLDALTDAGEISGDITTDQTWTSGHSYSLKGGVRVMPGVTLTIEPCVKVIGETSDSVLAVLAGALGDTADACKYSSGEPGPPGKLVAVGEPMAPIVFTSSKPKGQRSPGDWGGVILMGNGQNNLASAGYRVPIEGLARTECFGWNTDKFNTESSGKLQYVRIEYASKQLVAGNETNGLTLGALGSGTELHYVMVSNSNDDCFEWFGGAVNADHLIALNCEDDMFDGDNGFSGKLQFLFGRQAPTTTEIDSRGFEIDGAPNAVVMPPSSMRVSNFTVCGGGSADHNNHRDGIVLRKYAQNVSLMNGMATGFAGAGYFVQADSSNQAVMTFVQIWGNATGLVAPLDASNGNMGVDKGWFLNQTGNTTSVPDRFCDCWSNPPVPVTGTTAKGAPTTGFPDESAAYIGAFSDASASSNWMRGAWVDWSSQ